MKQTSLRGIAKKAARDKAYRFRNLFGILTVDFLLWSWRFINKRAASGVDKQDAKSYQEYLQENIQELVAKVKAGTYRAKLVLRRYIPKLNGRRALGIPAIADKVLQIGVSKILEAIYEQDFLSCSYGYRPGVGALTAVKDLSAQLRGGRIHYVVEADIRGFFDNIDHRILIALLEQRIDDKAFLRLIRKWLKAGILDTDDKVIHPETGTPQGGIVSPLLANIYLHYALDVWFQEIIKPGCQGAADYYRYADDFVCVFQSKADAEHFYEVLGDRLGEYGLTLAEEKTNLIRFSCADLKGSGAFTFLGFEYRWGISRWRKPVLKRRTDREKSRTSLGNFREWCHKNCRVRMEDLFDRLRVKLRGYYNYYGVRGNYRSLHAYYYQVCRILYREINRRSQRRSYNWKGFNEVIKVFELPRPNIRHAF